MHRTPEAIAEELEHVYAMFLNYEITVIEFRQMGATLLNERKAALAEIDAQKKEGKQ